MIRLATWSSTSWPRNTIRSRSSRRVDVEGAVAPVALLDHGGDEDLAEVVVGVGAAAALGRAAAVAGVMALLLLLRFLLDFLVLPRLYQM